MMLYESETNYAYSGEEQVYTAIMLKQLSAINSETFFASNYFINLINYF